MEMTTIDASDVNNHTTTNSMNRNVRVSTRNRSSESRSLKQQQKEACSTMLDLAVKMYKNAIDAGNKKVPPNTFENIMKAFGNPSWLNRDSIFYHYKKIINVPANNNGQDANTIPDEVALGVLSETSDITVDMVGRNMGGSPVGKPSGKDFFKKLEEARVMASNIYKERKQYRQLDRGELKDIITRSVE
jgi:hypothetical protein